MSTFASAVINKSGRKLAPKAPVRRAGAASQPSDSTKASAERNLPAQTVPPSAPQTGPASPPPTLQVTDTSPATASSSESTRPANAKRRHVEGSTVILAPSRKIGESAQANLRPKTSEPIGPGAAQTSRKAEEPARKRQRTTTSRKRLLSPIQATAEESNAAENGSEEPVAAPSERVSRSRKTKARATVEIVTNEVAAVGRGRPKRNCRPKRLRTPENAETIEISPSVVKMADLCKDPRTGRKSKRETELQNMCLAQIARKRARKKLEVLGTTPQPTEEAAPNAPEQTADEMNSSAPRMRIVNGEIVLDSSSLQVDRHAQLTTHAQELEEVEENPLSRKINSASWQKKTPAVSWGEDKTALFYRGLRMFGTDFMMISRMFPDRSRRSIKLKFANEERLNPLLIKQTLLGPREEVDLAQFSLMTNTVYEDPSTLNRELDEDRKLIEEQHAKDKETHDEMIRQAEEAAAEAAAAESSAKENEEGGSLVPVQLGGVNKRSKSSTKTKREKAQKASVGHFEVLGTIERGEQLEGAVTGRRSGPTGGSPTLERESQSKPALGDSLRARGGKKSTGSKKKSTQGKLATVRQAEILGSVEAAQP